jgi:hypothetical protein
MEKEKKIKKFAAEAYCSADKETATKSASPYLMPFVAQATNRHDRCSAAFFSRDKAIRDEIETYCNPRTKMQGRKLNCKLTLKWTAMGSN